MAELRRVNVAAPAFTYDETDPEGFRAGMFRFGPLLGAKDTGASVYELAPGQALCPYHYEYGEEEWLLVLAGRPSVRHPEGTDELAPSDVVFFPRGPDGAHQVRNDSGETARVIMWSPVVTPTATVYPDSDKVAIWTGVPTTSLRNPTQTLSRRSATGNGRGGPASFECVLIREGSSTGVPLRVPTRLNYLASVEWLGGGQDRRELGDLGRHLECPGETGLTQLPADSSRGVPTRLTRLPTGRSSRPWVASSAASDPEPWSDRRLHT